MEAQVIAGRYRLEGQLGVGGMSAVWAATDLELDRAVAVKLLAPGADPARFEREARAAAVLSHPSICALYDYGEDAGRRYMVLEYLPGGSLDDRLADGSPLADAEAGRIAGEIASGLAHAHRRGFVHRDLKPSNILFDEEGRAKIADFGIAQLDAATGLTEAGTVLGTAAYISPEQAAGATTTAASDVYSFGVILFRMLTGRLPFESPDAFALAAMHRDRPPPAISELRSDAPPLLESVATAALAKSPADRPADGQALLAELGGGIGVPPPHAPAEETALTEGVVPPPAAPRHRVRTAALVALLSLLAAAGVGLAVGVGSGGKGPSIGPPRTTQRTDTATTASTVPPSSGTVYTGGGTATTGTTTTTSSTTTTEPRTTTTRTTRPTTRPMTTRPTTTALPPPASTDTTYTDTTYTDTTTYTSTDTTTYTYTDTTATTPTAAAIGGETTTTPPG